MISSHLQQFAAVAIVLQRNVKRYAVMSRYHWTFLQYPEEVTADLQNLRLRMSNQHRHHSVHAVVVHRTVKRNMIVVTAGSRATPRLSKGLHVRIKWTVIGQSYWSLGHWKMIRGQKWTTLGQTSLESIIKAT